MVPNTTNAAPHLAPRAAFTKISYLGEFLPCFGAGTAENSEVWMVLTLSQSDSSILVTWPALANRSLDFATSQLFQLLQERMWDERMIHALSNKTGLRILKISVNRPLL